MDAEKTKKIKSEISKLRRQFAKLDPRSKKIAESLISNAAFMIVTLQDLQDKMNENGVVSEYKNGENQYGTKKSPEVEIYNSMVKNHMSIMKQLTDLIPKESGDIEAKEAQKSDGFEEFVASRDRTS